jgi:hypothetical protein
VPHCAQKSRSPMDEDLKVAGVPLSFREIGGPKIEIMTGAFDRPDRMVPTQQFGSESRLGWVGTVANLPSKTTMQNYGPEKLAEVFSYQHPDHD